MTIGTVAVDCPRCDDKFDVSLELGPSKPAKPGAKSITVPIRITDLAERFEEHYRNAGHVECP